MAHTSFFPTLDARPATLDENGLPKRIIAIADIHGMATWMDGLIESLARMPIGEDAAFYILGDLVDRGPDSRGVIDRVAALMERRSGSRFFIGNHDMWFRQFLLGKMDAQERDHWLGQGGSETLNSYQVADGATETEALDLIQRQSPSHIQLLMAAESIGLVGDFAFVHAGVDPQRPLDQQSEHACAWIRAPFMRHEGHLSHVVVHGHTPQKGRRPTVTENRISIDTGAVYGGALTAALIDREAGTLDFLAYDGTAIQMTTPSRLDRGFGTILDRYPSRPGRP